MKKLLSILVCIMIAMSSFGFVGCNREEGSLKGGKADVTYTISVEDAVNGSLTADKNKVVVGESATFTVTPNAGYVLAGLYLNGAKISVNGNSYTIKNVLRNYSAEAVFAVEKVELSYVGEGTEGLSGKLINYGETLGELETPTLMGSCFIGWKNEEGEFVTEYDKVTAIDGSQTLTAVFEKYDETLKEIHTPFSIATSYYDAQATKYGVTWHTSAQPINPVLLAVEGDSFDFANAKSYEVDTFNWMMTHDGDEWICSGVIDGLKFDTTYSVKFGDYSVNAWSDVYTFTTREENPETAKFIYLTDTQQKEPTTHTDGKTHSRTYNTLNDAFTRFPEADFIAHGGDLVQEGAYACQWQGMLYNFEDYLFDYPMQFVNGNHERIVNGVRDNPHNTDKIFNIDYPGKNNPNYDMQNGVFYSFDYGPLHYVVINSNEIYVNGRDLDEVQVAWLIDDVTKARQNPDTKWVVAMTHHAPYPNLLYDVDVNYAAQLVPLLDQLNVDLLLYGHNHALTVTHPIVWDSTLTADATGMKAKVVSSTTENVSYDGEVVKKYVYPEGTTDYGTVLHQTGAGGIQCGDRYVGIDMANYPYWSIITGGGKTNWPEIDMQGSLSMYTYVEVSSNSLVVRTYGVDTLAQINLANGSDVLSTGYYLNGFMLTR